MESKVVFPQTTVSSLKGYLDKGKLGVSVHGWLIYGGLGILVVNMALWAYGMGKR